MYDYVCQILVQFVNLLTPLIFIRIVLDSIRNYIFKNN